MKSLKSLIKQFVFHPNKWCRLSITFVYATICLLFNFFIMQVFCVPILWSAILFLLVFLNILFFEEVSRLFNGTLSYFLLGLSVPVLIYCIIFLADPWEAFTGYMFFSLCLLLFGIGLPAFFPFYLLLHVARYFKMGKSKLRYIFALGVTVPIMTFAVYSWIFNAKYEVIINGISQNKTATDSTSVLSKDYFTERLLGIGLKYHTKIEFMYDGARPPLHDPFLNAFLWFKNAGRHNGFYPMRDYLDFETQIKCYRETFPEFPLKASCPCSFTKSGLSYFRNSD